MKIFKRNIFTLGLLSLLTLSINFQSKAATNFDGSFTSEIAEGQGILNIYYSGEDVNEYYQDNKEHQIAVILKNNENESHRYILSESNEYSLNFYLDNGTYYIDYIFVDENNPNGYIFKNSYDNNEIVIKDNYVDFYFWMEFSENAYIPEETEETNESESKTELNADETSSLLAADWTNDAYVQEYINSQPESKWGYGYLDENNNYISPIKYGEIKDGNFVRTHAEELNTFPYLIRLTNPEIYNEESEKIRIARCIQESEFTKEMKDFGYIWYDSIAPVADPDDGDPGENYSYYDPSTNIIDYDEDGNPIIAYGTGYVQIIASVDPQIQSSCYVTVRNALHGNTYNFLLEKINDYKTYVALPAGEYYIIDGGVVNDYSSYFPFNSLPSLNVEPNGANIFECEIGYVNEEQVKNGVTIKFDENGQDNNTNVSKKEKKKINLGLVFSLFVTLTIIIAVVYFYKKTKKNNTQIKF